ncbi:hypothetical protein GIB67_014533 [Kingdonia uniflora]|uniref:Agenet domain-containing protein n=1 Tax=Kingdonia uniflora TaxID=39325 RepID=A0A7J7L4W0_9MAGN|nr:hypothetical protein GIB67_014533 [Kingdonia uniflora]
MVETEALHLTFSKGQRVETSPPKEEDPTFGIHEEVDVFWNDGWWKGEIVEVFKDDMFVVYFSNSNESTEFDRRDLRVHLEWINGRWLLPEEVRRMKQLQQQKKKNLKPQNVEGVDQLTIVSKRKGRPPKVKAMSIIPSKNGFEEKSSGGEAGDGDIKTERELKDAGKAMKRLSWNIINKDDQPLSTLFKEHSSQSQASSNHKMVGQTNKGITIEMSSPMKRDMKFPLT